MDKKILYRKLPQLDVACANCIRVKINDIDGLERENQERISSDNKNIDPERRGQNLFIHGLDKDGKPIINGKKFTTSLKERILEKIKNYGVKIRQDRNDVNNKEAGNKKIITKESVVAEGIIFQLSHDLTMKLLAEDNMLDAEGKIIKGKQLAKNSKTYQLFVDTYLFACQKYGAFRIVGAYIHLDEYTPHMHLYIIPLWKRVKMYRKQEMKDENGKPIYWYTLNAKQLFSRESIKSLWQQYGKAMAKYGARPATGLVPKGEYDKQTSMEVVRARKEEEIKRLDSEVQQTTEELSTKRKELAEITNNIDKFRRLEKMLLPIYTSIKTGLQAVFDKVMGKEKARVVDFDVTPEENVTINQYGVKTNYTDWHYSVLYEMNDSPNQRHQISAEKDDYYQSKDPLVKEISNFFFNIQEPAELARKMKRLTETWSEQKPKGREQNRNRRL